MVHIPQYLSNILLRAVLKAQNFTLRLRVSAATFFFLFSPTVKLNEHKITPPLLLNARRIKREFVSYSLEIFLIVLILTTPLSPYLYPFTVNCTKATPYLTPFHPTRLTQPPRANRDNAVLLSGKNSGTSSLSYNNEESLSSGGENDQATGIKAGALRQLLDDFKAVSHIPSTLLARYLLISHHSLFTIP